MNNDATNTYQVKHTLFSVATRPHIERAQALPPHVKKGYDTAETTCDPSSIMFELLLTVSLAIITLISGHNHPILVLVALVIILPGFLVIRKGAPFIPSSRATTDRMIRLAAIKPGDIVYDLGCGDGRIVFAAAAKGARAIGYERSLPTFLLAWLRSWWHPGSRIRFRDFWKQDYRDADVIFCFLLISTMQTFEKRIWPTLKPGCRVVSHAFRMAGVTPTKVEGNVVVYVQKSN